MARAGFGSSKVAIEEKRGDDGKEAPVRREASVAIEED